MVPAGWDGRQDREQTEETACSLDQSHRRPPRRRTRSAFVGRTAPSLGLLLRRLAGGFPFAQGLSVTRRDVRILRIGADIGENFPRARALLSLGQIGQHRKGGNL